MLTINQELQQGRYRISKQFGQGKTVSFFEACDNVRGMNVLLKRTAVQSNGTADLTENARKLDVFAEESKFLTEMQHDGFLQIFDYFHDEESQYLVMELVDGKNLGELFMKNEEPFALADVVDWGEQMLDALHYLHKKTPPIIYFNLRPPNIHLTVDGKIKMLATGIGSKLDENGHVAQNAFDAANVSYSPLELIWQKLDAGTKRVISNGYDEKSEMILLLPPDERCDIYSLGATMYQLLTNQKPKDALERSFEVLEGKNDPLVFPRAINSAVSEEISTFLMKALEINRENRFQSALEMRKALVNGYIQLRNRKAQELRSEVPVAPGLPAVRPKPVEPKLPNVIAKEPALKVELETKEPGSVEEPIVPIPEKTAVQLPVFGMDFDLLELVNIPGDSMPTAEEPVFLDEVEIVEEPVLEKVEIQEIETVEVQEIETVEVQEPEIVEEQEVGKLQLELVNEPEPEIVEEPISEDVLQIEEAVQLPEPETEVTAAENEEWPDEIADRVEEPAISSEERDFISQEADESEEFAYLFGEQKPESNLMKKLAIAAVALFMIGGGAFGIMKMMPSAADSAQQSTSQGAEAPDSQPIADPQTEGGKESPTDVGDAQNSEFMGDSAQPNSGTTEKAEQVKDKPAATQIATAKTPDASKAAANEKKKVTVDDLINDTPKKKVTVDDLIKDN